MDDNNIPTSAKLWPLPYLLELSGERISTDNTRLPFKKNILQYDVQCSLADLVTEPIRVESQIWTRDALADFLELECLYVVSDAFKALIEPLVKNTEFFPAEVELTTPTDNVFVWGGGAVCTDYWMMNCWNRLDLIEWGQSV